jgi:O-antigen ligase
MWSEISNINIVQEIIWLKNWSNPFIIFFVLFNVIDSDRTCQNTIFGLSLLLFVTALIAPLISLGVLDILPTYDFYHGRAAGFAEPNQYASYLVLFIPLVFTYVIFTRNPVLKVINLILAVVTLVALITTGSRGGAISFFFSVCLYLLLLKRKKILRTEKVVFLMMLVGFLASISYLLAPSTVREEVRLRVDPRGVQTIDKYSSGRIVIWRNTLILIGQRPILGHGQQTFSKLYYKNFGRLRGAHNQYLSYAVQFGILGVCAFILVFIKIFRHVWYNFESEKNISLRLLYLSYLSGFMGYAVSMLFVDVSTPRYLFWMYTAIIYKLTHLNTN